MNCEKLKYSPSGGVLDVRNRRNVVASITAKFEAKKMSNDDNNVNFSQVGKRDVNKQQPNLNKISRDYNEEQPNVIKIPSIDRYYNREQPKDVKLIRGGVLNESRDQYKPNDIIDSASIREKLIEFVQMKKSENKIIKNDENFGERNDDRSSDVKTILHQFELNDKKATDDCNKVIKKKPDSKRDSDCKLLIHSAREGNYDTTQWLLEHGIDPNIKNNKGRNALLSAACSNRLDVFKLLLQVSDLSQVDDNGWNALHISVVCGHIKIVEESVKHISIDTRTSSGLSALCLASNLGNLEIVKYLLKCHADPLLASYQGWTSLHFASRSSKPNHYTILLHLITHIKRGKSKDQLDIKTQDGLTPLLLAVQSGSLECVKLLLDSGANPNIKDKRGWSPARIAAINNFTDISNYLSNYNAVM